MILSLRRTLLASLVLVLLAGAASAADAPAVRDAAGFFKDAATRKANEDLGTLKDEFGTELRIETVKSVPDARLAEVKTMTTAQREQYFAAWARERAAAEKVHGVYVLICKSPTYLQVEVGKDTQKKAFTPEDRKALRDAMFVPFKAKEFDQGLRAAVDLYRDRLNKNVPPTERLVVHRVVKDYAGFFTPAAVQKANDLLKNLPPSPGKDVAVETFPTPPNPEKVQSMSSAQRSKYFKEWVENRGAKNNLQGVLMVITKKPGHLQVDVRGSVARQLIPPADFNKLEKELLSRLGSREYDRGLLDAVSFLRNKLGPPVVASNTQPPVPPVNPVKQAVPQAAAQPLPPISPVVPVPPVVPMPPVISMPVVPATVTTKAEANGQIVVQGKAGPNGSASVAVTGAAAQKDPWDLTHAKEKVQEVAETKFETWKWVVGIVVGLLGLWILLGILRALFGGRRQAPPAAAPAPRPTPQSAPHYPPAAPQNPAAPQYPAGQGSPLVRPAPAAGYSPVQQANYPANYPGAVPPAPMQPARGGGGFMGNVLGGMFGAAAGSWIYDSFRRGGGSAPAAPAYPPSAPPYRAPTSQQPNVASDDAYNRGGDFDASSPTASAASDGGGDFGAAPTETADIGGGGDFGTPASSDLGGGGDFGSPQTADLGGGGDFGSDQTAEGGGGGDFGASQTADMGGGGDFGAEPPAPPDQFAQNDAGGDFNGGGSFDSPAGGDQGGGDMASNTGSDQGGDFG